MTDTVNLDTSEKVDILLKSAYGFPSADETRAWYEETAVKFNDSFNGEDVFVEIIPDQPDFDTNGTVKTATDIGLNTTDFKNYSDDDTDKSSCSIVDDSTGTVRRYKLLILEQTPQLSSPGLSWFKLNSSGKNVIQDSFQFNFKQYESGGNVIQPYLYKVNTEKSLSTSLPFGKKGGNYFIDLKSGILFFSDFGNFSNGTQTNSNFQVNTTDNKPVLTIYSYIGKKGITNATTNSTGATGATGPIGANVWFENMNLLNLEDYNDNTGTRFVPTAGFIYSQGFIAPITGPYNKLKLKIKNISTDSHTIECAIYDSSFNGTQDFPLNQLTYGKSTITANNNDFIDINFDSAPTLTRGDLFFVSVKHTSSVNSNILNFWGNKNSSGSTGLHKLYISTSSHTLANTMPSTFTLDGVNDTITETGSSKALFWFIVNDHSCFFKNIFVSKNRRMKS